MIRLSTKGRYGTRLMLNLARRFGNNGSTVILRDISDEEGISIRYLEQIIIPLKINKLVKSVRGAGGGYMLARDPSLVKMSEILLSLEGTCCLVECVEDPDYCEEIPYCPAHEVWKEATTLLKEYFESISLKELMAIEDRKLKGGRGEIRKRT